MEYEEDSIKKQFKNKKGTDNCSNYKSGLRVHADVRQN